MAKATKVAVEQPTTELDSQYRAPATDMETLLTKCVIFRVQLGRWGISKKLPRGSVQTPGTMPEWVKAQKTLISDCSEYDAIVKLHGEIRGGGSYLDTVSLPSPFGSGSYAVPIGLVRGVNDKFLEYTEQLASAVDAFLAVYVDARGVAEVALGPRFDPLDYPSPERVRGAFFFKWNFHTLATPESLPADILEQERAKVVADVSEWRDDIRTALRASLSDMVSHLVERLSAGAEDGKPKIFRDTALTKMQGFLDTFAERDITNDRELSILVARAREVVSGVGVADDLRKRADIREPFLAGFAEIKASLDTMIEDRPFRTIRVRDRTNED